MISRASAAFASLLFGTLALSGCRTAGDYVWIDDYTRFDAVAESEYRVLPGDVLQVRVYNQDNMTTRTKVREDGMISMPFVNDVQVSGLTPAAIATDLAAKLKNFINKPVVSVSLEEIKPLAVSIIGEVKKPGLYQLEPGVSVLHAIAAAGGFTDYANEDDVYVLRKEAAGRPPLRLRFRYHELAHVEGKAALFRLRAGDAVVVE
ncbi:MAG: polysaccharide biosynthesis/export family protein [Myxococcaceae bacterium]